MNTASLEKHQWIAAHVFKTGLTKPEFMTLVKDSKASHCDGWNKTDFEFFKYEPPILPINCFGINCIINFCGQLSAFLEFQILNELGNETNNLHFRFPIFGIGWDLARHVLGNFLLVCWIFWLFDPFKNTMPNGVSFPTSHLLSRLLWTLKFKNKTIF